MKRELGASSGFLAILALLLHTQFAPSEGVAQKATSVGNPTSRKKASQKKSETGEPEILEGPWIATRAFFNVEEQTASLCNTVQSSAISKFSCLLSPTGAPNEDSLRSYLGLPREKDWEMWSIVATFADPLRTRLAMFLDREIEGLQRALQANRWEFAGQWLPWDGHREEIDTDNDKKSQQEELSRARGLLPGVLIFRNSANEISPDKFEFKKRVLFVFVVPETPTTGISGPAFYAAMHLASLLSTDQHKIGLLAPTFSGSLMSLSNLVCDWRKAPKNASPRLNATVYAGSVSNSDYADAFHNKTGLAFHSGNASTKQHQKVFCKVLDRYSVEFSDAAYLVEDNTAFAASFGAGSKAKNEKGQESRKDTQDPQDSKDDCDQIVTYVFPRDIAHLRNAYQEATGAEASDKARGQAPSVNFSIKDTNNGEDSVPVFSDSQTPLSQSAAIESIVQELKRK